MTPIERTQNNICEHRFLVNLWMIWEILIIREI